MMISNKDIYEELKKTKENKDYIKYIKLLVDNENEFGVLIEIFSIPPILMIEEIIKDLKKEKKYDVAINKIDEVLIINGIPNIIKAFCLNYKGCIFLELSKNNKKKAFELFYSALELCNDEKLFSRNVEASFPFSENIEEVEICINKVYKYKDKFSEKFISILEVFKMAFALEKKEYNKAYDIGLKHITKIHELFENNKEIISIIINIFIKSASEVYSNYIEKKDYSSAENIYNSVNNLLKDQDEKDRTNIIFGISLILLNEIELGLSKINSIKEFPGKEILLAFCYQLYIKDNLKDNNKFEKCLNYMNILKSLNIEDENIEKEISYLDFLIFIRKCEIEFEKNDFSSYEKIKQMIEKETDIRKRLKLEELQKSLIKKKKDFYFKEKDYNEFLKDNKNILNLISEVYQEESIEEIDKKNYNIALNKIEKALEINPNDTKCINNKAYINTQKGNYDEAIKDIDKAMKIEPENKIFLNNKLEIIGKKYENISNKILTNKEKEYIENNIKENDDINIKQNSVDLSLKLTKNKVQKIDQNTMKDIINNNILLIKENKNMNIIKEENEQIKEKEKIILASKSSELILENIKSNNINKLDKEIKQKIEECLDIKEKDIQNNILSTYAQIKNLDKKEMQKPLEIINNNLKYETNHQEISKNVEAIQNFLQQDKNLEIKSEITSNLIEFISNNDYNKYTEEEREKDEILDNKKPLLQYFKDKTKEGIAKQLKETLNEYSYDINLSNQIKGQIEQYIDIDNCLLKNSQREKKETNNKIFNCIQTMAKSEKGLSKQNLENFGNLLKKIQENNDISDDYKNYVTNKIIETINISIEHKNDKNDLKIPDNLMTNLSNELNNNLNNKKILNILDKATDNQKLTEESQDNLVNILIDKNIEKNNNINKDDEYYELTYKILNKNYNNLSECQKKVVNLEKNTIILNNENKEEKIINSLETISTIVNDGYSINKHTEKTILNLLNKNSENEKYIEKSTEIINNMAINSMDISNEMSEYIIKKIDENKKKPKLSKQAFTQLIACLVNIVDNCNIPQNSVEAFQNCLENYKNKEKNAELKLAITGLSILSKKHYSLNKEAINSCLDIIECNILEENSLKELSNTIDIIFKETDIDNNTFTKLLLIIIKNPDLLDKLSICLINSLKFKKEKDIESIIEKNLGNFEKLVKNNLVNDNIIKIIKLLDINYYQKKNQFLYEFYYFDLFYSQNVFKNVNFKKCLSFINKYGIINEKYLAILFLNLNSSEVFDILEKILEKNPKYLKQQIYDNMLKIRVDSNLFKRVLLFIKKFSNYFITIETIDALIEKSQTNKKEIYEPIIELINIFYEKNKNDFSQMILKNKDIIEIEIKEEKTEEYLTIINNFINKSIFVPDRYFNKLFRIIKEEKKLYNFGHNIFLLAINKNLIIPNEIIDRLLESNNKELEIKLIQSLLINKKYKKVYEKKILKILEENSKEINLQIINGLQSLIDFSNLENIIKEFILKKANIYYENLIDYQKLCFWILQDISYCQKLFEEIKISKFSDNYKGFDKFKKYEEKINFFLNDGIFYDKIKELTENNNDYFNLLKTSVNNFENKILNNERNKKLKIIKLLDFFISQKIKYGLNFHQIIQCFNVYLSSDNYLQLNQKFERANENYFNIIRKNWIKIKILNKNIKYSTDIINTIIDNFYKYEFEDSLIEKTINLSIFSSIEDINQLFSYLKENMEYLKDIKNVINIINKDDSIQIIKNKSIWIYSEKKISDSTINPKMKPFYLLIVECLIKINWKLYQIDKLLSIEIKIDKMDESFFKDVIIPIIENSKIEYTSINNKNENLLAILSNYKSEYWEYLIKQLGQEQTYGSIEEFSLENLIDELKKNNKNLSDQLCEKIKNIILKIRLNYNCIIEDNELPKFPINKYEKKNIQKWIKSKRTLSLLNKEEFLPEILAIINRANVLNDGYHIRNVQFISILLILLSPKDKGVFAQIKTGEGKSTIVAVIAVIKALQNKYVDILSSSIVLAHRDKNEKKKFYEYFNLTVGSSDDKDEYDQNSLYEKNIVYGDTLMFEGDILEVEFSKNPNSKRAKNQKRGFRCIIIDEVDSMCIDNLGSSTRLSTSFPSYEYLKIIYPLIYNSLNIIDEHMDKGYYGDIQEEEKRKETVITNLIKVTKEILKKNKESKENKFILPKNLQKYIDYQIPYWCNSAYEAKHYYRENIHYVIGKDKIDESYKEILENRGYIPEENYKIGPVDFSNTGVVDLHVTWSNGLTQFLQIKHGLKLKAENLTTTFISHYSFFTRYINKNENNIYGVTGTIGTNKSKFVLKELFKVNIFIIPPFKPSKLILLKNKAQFQTKEDWKNEIYNNIELNAKLGRAVLVICLTIEESNEVYDFLIKKGYKQNKIYKYQRNDDETNKLNKGKYDEGDVIIATNLAGRGTDIKLTEKVQKNGGMHVIVTFLPSNQRVEEQAMGRTARSGAKGSSIIIVNDKRKIDNIKLLRDYREEKRMENIVNNSINKIKLKDELFNKFSLLYHDLQNQFIKNDLLSLTPFSYYYYKEEKFSNEFSILDDLEERWGFFLKEMKIDDLDNTKSENEIKKLYETFEFNIKKVFNKGNVNDIPLLNPFNYYSGKRFKLATEKDSDLCLFSNYLNDMTNIKEKTESITTKISDMLDNTITSLKDNLSPQIQSITVLANSIKNKELLSGTIMKEMSEEADNKLKVVDNLINQIQDNKNLIDQYLNNNKKGNIVLQVCELKELTKNIDIENYFKDIGIPYFYKMTLQKEKNWFGMISIIVIGVFEIGLGILLTRFMNNDFGLFEEGLNDIMHGINCLLGKEEFDWKEIGKRKLAFAIGLAVNFAVRFIRGNLTLPFKKVETNIKDTFKIVGEKVKKKLIKEGLNTGIQLSMKFFGKDFVITIVTKFKDFSKSISITYFENKIKGYINKVYGETFEQMLTIEVVSGNNDWTRILTQQLKVCCRAFTKLTNIVVKQLINLIKMLINKEGNWKECLIGVLKDCSLEGLDIFKKSLNESLESIGMGFLNIFKKFAEKKLPDGVKNGLLTFNDILDKALDLGDSLKSKNLMDILVENNIVSENGIINGKLIFGGESYRQKKFNPIPVITDKFKKFIVKKAIGADNLVDLINKELENIFNELEDFIKKKVDEGKTVLDNFMEQKLNEINIFIDNKFNEYITEAINKIEITIKEKADKFEQLFDKIESEINNKTAKINDFSKMIEENLNENISKIENLPSLINEKVNEKIKLYEDIIDNKIDEKIKMIKEYISTFENNISSKLDEFKEQLKNENENKENNSNQSTNNEKGNTLSEVTKKAETKITDIKNSLSEKIISFNQLIQDIKQKLDDKIAEFEQKWNDIKNSNKLNEIKKTIKQIQSVLEKIITEIIKIIKNIKEKSNKIVTFIKSINSSIIEKLKNIKEGFKNKMNSFDEMKNIIKDALNEIKNDIKNKIMGIKEDILNISNSLKEIILNKISDFIIDIKSNFKGYAELLKDLIDKIEKFILEKMNEIEEKLELNKIDDALNSLGESLNKVLKIEKINDKIKDADKLLSDKMHNALEDIDFKEFKDKKNEIINSLRKYQKQIDDYDFDSKKNETFNILQTCLVNSLFEIIIDAFKGSEVGGYLKGVMDGYKDMVEEASKFIDENTDGLDIKK